MGTAIADARSEASVSIAYRIGSITKTFTAAATLLLAADGQLDIDAPVGKYVAGTTFGSVPLRMLLAHTGGIQREVPHPMWNSMRGPTSAELLDAVRQADVLQAPGVRWHYSNLGYAVMGQVLSSVTGDSFREVIASRLLRPLGLTGTDWQRPAGAI